jgi:hypothetical protein
VDIDDWLAANSAKFGYLDLISLPDRTVGVWLLRDGSFEHFFGCSMVRLPCEAMAIRFIALCCSDADEQELEAFIGHAWKCGCPKEPELSPPTDRAFSIRREDRPHDGKHRSLRQAQGPPGRGAAARRSLALGLSIGLGLSVIALALIVARLLGGGS